MMASTFDVYEATVDTHFDTVVYKAPNGNWHIAHDNHAMLYVDGDVLMDFFGVTINRVKNGMHWDVTIQTPEGYLLAHLFVPDDVIA